MQLHFVRGTPSHETGIQQGVGVNPKLPLKLFQRYWYTFEKYSQLRFSLFFICDVSAIVLSFIELQSKTLMKIMLPCKVKQIVRLST